jgi:hypothetical protein
MNQMPTMQEMRRLSAAGKLKGPQMQYFEETKPVEELYDTASDPYEVRNLAADPRYWDVLERMRKAHIKWVKETGDIGRIPEPEFDEMKRPGGQWQKTTTPTFGYTRTSGEDKHITITCATEGASIAYRIGKGSGWKLYTEPIPLKTGRVLYSKACRIGFRDSDEVRFKLGDSPTAIAKPKAASHWRDELDRTDLLKRLRRIKKLDYKGEKAIPKYFEALADEYASVRYWAVVGLHNNCKEFSDVERVKVSLKKILKDPAPVVRIAAAHALCDWDHEKEALPVLVEALKCDTDKARLYAIIALKKIGAKARPALSRIKPALKDSDNYVQRVTRALLAQLENK